MPFLASDVAADARSIYLNDSAQAVYTDAALLPHIQMANRALEKELVIYGIGIQRMASAAIAVLANAKTLNLPADFFLPVKLYERDQGGTATDWQPMYERIWIPENYVSTNSNIYWNFANNNINLPGAIVNKEVLLEYDRTLAAITSISSPEDTTIIRDYLGSVTAESAARNIGMNESVADSIRDNYVAKHTDDLTRVMVLNNQGISQRRIKFTSKRMEVY